MSKVIGTHSGTFHCDEALAIAMLRRTKDFAASTVVRTRDTARLATCDIVVDVGGTYDVATHRFDHHQRGFAHTMPGFSTTLSSAGLIYRHFGRELIEQGLKAAHADVAHCDTVFARVYVAFMEAIDAIDNGISRFDTDAPARYALKTDLSSRVGQLNPPWHVDASDDERDRLFERAVELTGGEFDQAVNDAILNWLPARQIVQSAMEARSEHPEILVLSQYCPWQSHLFSLEGADDKILYVLFADSGREGAYRVAAVPEAPDSFTSRKALPAAWRGLRDGALDDVSGIKGTIFCHAGGFIGGADSFDGALAMAIAAVANK